MKLLDREEPLDPRAQRELEAVDRALGGATSEPDLEEWAELTALVLEERPEPDEEWAVVLDRAASAGFPRRGSGARAKLSEIRPMRIAAPAMALATFVVIAVVSVSTLGGDSFHADLEKLPESASPLRGMHSRSSDDSAVAESAGAGSGGLRAATKNATPEFPGAISGASAPSVPGLKPWHGPAKIAPGTEKRQIDRDVQMTLSAKPDEVRSVSDRVIEITRSLDGIVASSQVSIVDGNRGSQATLQLTLPSRNLDAAIDQLTQLANVESLNEGTKDITRPFVSARNEVDDLQAQRRRLLEALGNATTEQEADSLRIQIEDTRHDISKADAALENVARRARLSDLSVTVVGDPSAKDNRDLGDWLDDAGSVLRDLAGILLISAAILVPLGLLAALVWLAVSWARRRRRERALD